MDDTGSVETSFPGGGGGGGADAVGGVEAASLTPRVCHSTWHALFLAAARAAAATRRLTEETLVCPAPGNRHLVEARRVR